MTIARLFGQVACADLDRSIDWFTTLFDRAPDRRPMDGLAEWDVGDGGGLQLFRQAENAGHSTLTLIVDDLRAQASRLDGAGLNPGPVEPASAASLVRLSDPDGNLVVLAEPGRV